MLRVSVSLLDIMVTIFSVSVCVFHCQIMDYYQIMSAADWTCRRPPPYLPDIQVMSQTRTHPENAMP